MIQQPFKGYFRISNPFGANPTQLLSGGSFYQADGMKGHGGIDFAMPTGTPIISPFNGTVIAVSIDIAKGEGVAVLSDDTFQWNGQDCKFDCIMWHMKDQSIVVKVGDKVTIGQLLGLSNNTGRSTGPHLHLSLMPLATDGSRRALAGMNNGYNGNIDPMPYLILESQPEEPQITRIKELQTLLNKYGATLTIDGKFGKLSNQALQSFLSTHGL